MLKRARSASKHSLDVRSRFRHLGLALPISLLYLKPHAQKKRDAAQHGRYESAVPITRPEEVSGDPRQDRRQYLE